LQLSDPSGATHEFELGGHLVAGGNGNAELFLPTLIRVMPATLFGGNLGFSLTEPAGYVGVSI
jgi:hypothetical protein